MSRREIDTLKRDMTISDHYDTKNDFLETYLVLCIDLFFLSLYTIMQYTLLRYFQGLLLRMSESWLILE